VLALDDAVRAHYDACEFAWVTREVMRAADHVNQRWDALKPWLLAKDPAKRDELHALCTECLLSFFALSVYLQPILPTLGERGSRRTVRARPRASRTRISSPLACRGASAAYEHLMTRIDPKKIEAMVEASKETLQAAAPAPASASAPAPAKKDESATISIDDFTKVDLRIARIVEPPRCRRPTSCCA
jgi:methionyl-tRNA synthetase